MKIAAVYLPSAENRNCRNQARKLSSSAGAKVGLQLTGKVLGAAGSAIDVVDLTFTDWSFNKASVSFALE